MTSVGLPSIAVWQEMRNRANCLPMLMQEAFQDDSPVVVRRVRACLCQLSALACFVQSSRFSLYCRECIKLLGIYEQQSSRRSILVPLLLRASVRAAQSLASPLMYLIDSANLNELRQARGASAAAHVTSVGTASWTVPRLQALLRKQLMCAHYTLGNTARNSERSNLAAQPNSFSSLNRVAALWLGEVLFESVHNTKNLQQTCMQILRLELCCHEIYDGAAPMSFSVMQDTFLELSIQKLFLGFRGEMRALMQQAERQGEMDLELSLVAFQKINACCTLLNSRQVLQIEKLSVSAQQLALHLRCWVQMECEARTLLCLCVLALERNLDITIAVQKARRPCERTDIRLRRKVQHFIRTRRRRLRTAYSVPASRVRAPAHIELQSVHHEFRQSLSLYKQGQILVPVEDGFLHALIRLKAISLYMGEMALFELLCNLRELVVMAIERRLLLTRILVAMLPRLTAYCLRSFRIGRRALGYDTRLINTLSEVLRVQRQIALSKVVLRDKKIILPTRRNEGKKKDKHSIKTTQLPSFLAKNIRGLIVDPEAIYCCQTVQEFASLSRVVILELTFLARGARALQVDRVAALSEVLLEIYRALSALSELPEENILKRNLQSAHRCLRLALNQAAARQKVCDVRPTIVSLYHFLECLHRVPADSPDSLQVALSAVNALTADLRAFADVFANALNHGRGGRSDLAHEQLRGLISAARRLQEDLAANGMINIARWGPPLMVAVGRYSNARGKSVRLDLSFDEIEAARVLVQQLQLPLERLLCLMIEHSVERAAARRSAGKQEGARLCIRAKRTGTELIVYLEDDGVGLTESQLTSVAEDIIALGGSLSLASDASSGTRLSVAVSCASARWDIASKSL